MDAYRRADFRRRLRMARMKLVDNSFGIELSADLGLVPSRLNEILSEPYFGMAWDRLQRESPVLLRRRLRFVDIPRQIEIARELLGTDCARTTWRQTLSCPLAP